MRECCPTCGAALRRHRVRPLGNFTSARRDCAVCSYSDKILEQPAVIVKLPPVVRRRTFAQTKFTATPVRLPQEKQ